ncbi:hypothetical protein NliqN6_3152 [Naganishia liquefaciens]|uniref:Uncharacterized protein n=1 Tax=Naganishia liquefaciens TaxID=104408 RepID=A0A8H3TT45_9TREE|nr:hypothetical protein NliqN6_3152 [Naganishia liquefaciens]
MFRRSASKRNVSSLGNGTPPNPAESVHSNLSDQGGSRTSSLLMVPNDMQTASNGSSGEGKAPVPKRRTSLSKAKSTLSTMFGKNSSRRSASERRDRSSASPAPSVNSSIKDSNESTTSARAHTKPPQAKSSGLATPIKSHRKDPPSGSATPSEDFTRESFTSSLPSQEAVVQTPAASIAPPIINPQITPDSSAILIEEPKASESAESDSPTPQGLPSRERSMSMYSQWSYDFDAADSDSDGEVYATPLEGLSEVEEEEEDDDDDGDFAAKSGPSAAPPPAYISHGAPGTKERSSYKQLKANDDDTKHKVRRAPVDVVKPDVVHGPRLRGAHVTPMSMEQQAECLDSDIKKCQEIIHLFLTSRMREAEALAHAADPEGQHMYIGNASCVIQAIKSMMTFDLEDLRAALEISRITSALAHSLRKSAGGVTSRLAGMVRSGAQTAHIKSMNKVQKHAELIYAETLLIKAVLGIVAGGDWVGLVKEALNMRTAYGIYRSLQVYLETYAGDPELDEHFKSGVQLGAGLSSLMLSLLPSKVMKVAELFGYGGDRKVALETLQAAGGWTSGQSQPGVPAEQEGVRRAICDMALLTFHLVISALMPISGVDIPLAKNILDWNMKRQVVCVFFMYFQSRYYTVTSQTERACEILQDALDLKLEYLQLQHICLWDMGVNNLVMCNFRKARSCFEILASESSWSKAVYMYCEAACTAEMQSSGEESADRQAALTTMMSEVPKNLKKIAGKSLPIEKFVSRKARKFASQNQRLILPAIELSYFFGTLPNAPPRIQFGAILPRIESHLTMISQSSPETYNGGSGYWDDYCLAHFLRGVALSFAAYPHEEALITDQDRKSYPTTPEAAGKDAMSSFESVLQHSIDIQLDHWIIYFTHFEMGRLYSQMGDNDSAKHQLELVMSGKTLELNTQARSQGKYSMESALMIRVHAGLSAIKEDPRTRIH